MTNTRGLPLHGIRIIELTHMVMGPAAGVVLGDLGADIIRIEPIGGDATRALRGSGAGYFPMYNRNKRSLSVDLKSDAGKKIVYQLVDDADVLIENFRPGTMERLGFGYDALKARNPALIYCSNKGFLSGPYEHRTALDEVTQMMGGLAYMTGPPGRPLRAGTSVVDVTGGMFGALGILAALFQRHTSGRGQEVVASLFESTVFLVGQHMAQYAVMGEPAAPMPARVSAWAIYQIFDTKDDDQVFVGIVSDKQWQLFCDAFELDQLATDPTLKTNNDRAAQKERLVTAVQEAFRKLTKRELMERLEKTGLPFAPIGKPEELLDDPHLNASEGLLEVSVTEGEHSGRKMRLPALPLAMGGVRFGVHQDIARAGEHTREILRELGYRDEEVDDLLARGIVACS
ncbi:MAG: CoA transferase [Deltaproteobacteria bacterium]|jgi:crotonobetainyl-CoA:carnitine CoA-transferase CaiB-like acyl-CoA transferase|nr:CoA transferase [Deltaproteobacteria bacterium]